jgi:carbamoyltransferase
MHKTLSINHGIGSSVGYFENGEAVFCVEEERFNRVKNWMGFPNEALAYTLNNYVPNLDVLDKIVISDINTRIINRDKFYKGYDRDFDNAVDKSDIALAYNRNSTKQLIDYYIQRVFNPQSILGDPIKDLLVNQYKLNFSKIERIDHHLCHASSVYYGLAPNLDQPYLIFTLDGGGDGIMAGVFKGEGGSIETLQRSAHFSIGNIYSAVTYFLGFTAHEHEYKLMGLAPYVNPKYAEKYKVYFQKFLALKNDDTEFYNPNPLDKTTFFKALLHDLKKDRFDNIAAGLQVFCEEIVIRWIKGNLKKYGIKNILGSGGVFMNVKMNMLISQIPEVAYFDVFPSCGDESNIFGAAYFTYNKYVEKKVNLLKHYTTGSSPSVDLQGALLTYQDKINVKQVPNINEYIAGQLADNKIIARCSGQMEFGARALGNRSIMANPGNLQNVTKINQAVKKRDFWMPFAPAMLADKMHEFVTIPASVIHQKSPYMMFAFEVKEGKDVAIICGTHQADLTARVESITQDRYPDFYEIIQNFHKKTGVACVLNTSFNLHGFPIVENSHQAIDVLINSKIDELVIDDYVISRK